MIAQCEVAAGRLGRRRPHGGTAARIIAVVVAVTTLVLVQASPVAAAWTARPPTYHTGGLVMAAPAHAFSGSNPAEFTNTVSLLSFVDTTYLSFTNSGTTAATHQGVIDGGSLPPGARVTLTACPVAWNTFLGTCLGGAVALASNILISSAPVVTYGTGVPNTAGQKWHLKLYINSVAFNGWVKLRVTAATLPAGGRNRTNG